MAEDLEVVWDGAHQNANRDLLLGLYPMATIQHTTEPDVDWHEPARHRPPRQIAAEIAAVLGCLKRRPCSRLELRTATGFSEQSVAVALNKLKKEGVIEQAVFGVWKLAA